MVKRDIIPAVIATQSEIASLLKAKSDLGTDYAADLEASLLKEISGLSRDLLNELSLLDKYIAESGAIKDLHENAKFQHDSVFAAMQSIRETVDALEPLCGARNWPYPSYAEMLLRN